MRRFLIAACAASLISLAACDAGTEQSPSATYPARRAQPADARPLASGQPAESAPAGEFETIRITVMGMG